MGRKSSGPSAQVAARKNVSGSGSSKSPKLAKAPTSTSGETLKPLSTSLKRPRVVESDEVEAEQLPQGSPIKRKRPAIVSAKTRKTADDGSKPSSTSKNDTQPKPKKAVAQPVEAGSEESEEEWVGFGNVSGENSEAEDGEVSEEELLHGLSSEDDQDSSDEEIELPGLDVSKLPTIARDDKTVKRKLEKAKRKPTEERGVVYLGRIPHGFYEEQMKSYFTQFGEVTRLRLSRNKKTGRSKHYAFIEFDSARVAQIVAETMDNYLLMGHILKCRVIPKSDVHPELWIGADSKFKRVPMARVYRVSHNKLRTEVEKDRVDRRLLQRQEQRKRKLKEAGIDYEFDVVAYKKKPRADSAAGNEEP